MHNEHLKAANYICGRDWSEGRVQFMARVTAHKYAGRKSALSGGLGEGSSACGQCNWWARQQADKGQVNAVCLLSSSRTSATQRANNTGSYQMTTLAGVLRHQITWSR